MKWPEWKQILRIFVVALVLSLTSIDGEAAAQTPVQKVRIAESIWGFDGRVVPGQFNPLSILLDNLSEDSIEGQVSVQLVTGMVRDSGGVHREAVFLSPNTRRWVQFYPYISRNSGQCRIRLETADGVVFSQELDQARSVIDPAEGDSANAAPPVMTSVILDRPGMTPRFPTSLKHLPAEIFPPYATAVVPLRVLFLDHVPDWEEPRRQALLSWLKSGGSIHLLRDRNGQELVFQGILSELNKPFAEFTVGSGRVTRHAFQRDAVPDQVVETATRRQIPKPDDVPETQSPEQIQMNALAGQSFDPSYSDSNLLMEFRRLTQPDHAWWLIFLLSLMYIGMIFPGCWFLSQNRKLHYLTTYGAIAGLAVVFSILFLIIGQRGYGEDTSLHSIGIARAEDDTTWNLFQWNSLFVTGGEQYQLRSDEQEAVLACGEADEAVAATIQSGNRAAFDVQIPPFSSQSVISRRRLKTPNREVRLASVELEQSGLRQLSITAGPEFPRDKECIYMVIHDTAVYDLSWDERKTTLGTLHNKRHLMGYTRPSEFGAFNNPWNPNSVRVGNRVIIDGVEQPENQTAEELFYGEALPRLVERSLLDEGIFRMQEFRLPADRIRLLVYAPISKELQLAVSTEAKTVGRVLFISDLFLNSP
jgi:hypothetical protein